MRIETKSLLYTRTLKKMYIYNRTDCRIEIAGTYIWKSGGEGSVVNVCCMGKSLRNILCGCIMIILCLNHNIITWTVLEM